MRLLFHSSALEDVREIVANLEEASAAAADRFLNDLRNAAALVADHPWIGHPTDRFRRWNLRNFPYHLLYLVDAENSEIWIMVVRHRARHPRHGNNRRPPNS
jgi:plasmid stabilization system protein ParE